MSSYLWGKEMGLDYAEFYLRHIHPTQNEQEKGLLRAAAAVIRERKNVVRQELDNKKAKEKKEFEEKHAAIIAKIQRKADVLFIKNLDGSQHDRPP